MLVYYKLSGINAVVALVFNLVILLGLMAYIGAVMTLPGIAGFVLTMGIGVDSNVLIFERIKKSSRRSAASGRRSTPASAACSGRWSTRTSAALISGGVPLPVRHGPDPRLRRDAVLRPGLEPVHVDLRLEDAVRDGAGEAPSGRHAVHLAMHIFKHANFNFLRWRWHAIALSWVIIIAGAISIWTKGIPKGVEFAGGTVVILQFETNPSVQQVREALDKSMPGGGQNTIVQTYGDPAQRQVMIRVPTIGAESGAALSKIGQAGRRRVEEEQRFGNPTTVRAPRDRRSDGRQGADEQGALATGARSSASSRIWRSGSNSASASARSSRPFTTC